MRVDESGCSIVQRIRAYWRDLVLVAVGVGLGVPSLLYPLGRDQGLYYYVAREWLLRGAVPYRDLLDHKTPGIYLVHALALALFGEVQWGIRVLDLGAVVAFGLAAGSLQAPAGTPIPSGQRGATVALLALLYYGFFDFWNTGQSELWYSGLGVASVWAAWRIEKVAAASVVAGLLAGAAIVVKPPSVWFVLVACAALWLRIRPAPEASQRQVVRTGLQFAAATLLIPCGVLAYFGAKHALPAMYDVVVGANAYYVKHESGAPGEDWRDHTRIILSFYAPFTLLFPLGLALFAWHRGAPEPHARRQLALHSALLLLAGVLAVVMQGKFYLLHWGACCVPFALLGCISLRGLCLPLPSRLRRLAAALVVVLAYVSTAWIPGSLVARFQSNVLRTELAYARGSISRAELDAVFTLPSHDFDYASSYRVGEWLRVHTEPGDTITVRGFQPEIYAISGRHHHGRFFWTTFLTAASRRYERKAWRDEDRTDLQLHPPRYVVTLTRFHSGPDSSEWFAPMGYRPVADMGEFTILSR